MQNSVHFLFDKLSLFYYRIFIEDIFLLIHRKYITYNTLKLFFHLVYKNLQYVNKLLYFTNNCDNK